MTEQEKRVCHFSFCFVAGLLAFAFAACTPHKLDTLPNSSVVPTNLAALVAVTLDTLKQLDIARVNMICAEGLPGAEHLDITNSLAVVDQMAARVRSETERHAYRFHKNPAEFEHSKGFYKMLMLGVVLAEDFKIHYRKDRQVSPETAFINDGFFGDARDVFLPGLLSEQRQGTCSSMPVLYIAVGRRLGYPLKLVTTKGQNMNSRG